MIDRLTNNILSLRSATAHDVKLLFEWLNTPSSLTNKGKSSKPVKWTNHQNWFNRRLNNPDVKIWIVELNSKAIGQVRIERVSRKLLIDIFISSLYRGDYNGFKALNILIGKCQKIYPGEHLYAKVKKENYRSYNLFVRAGFQEVTNSINDDMFYFIYKNSNNTIQ